MEGLVIAAHGSQLSPTASDPAHAHADRIRETGAFEEVRTAFWKEDLHLREVLRTLESTTVFVVPLFISEGYFTETVLPRALRLRGWDPSLWDSEGVSATAAALEAADVEATVHYCGPIGTHDSMTDVIVERAERVTGDPAVGPDTTLAIVGHGTDRNPRSARAIEYHRDRLDARGRFREVVSLFLDEEPRVEALTDHCAGSDVVLVPLFVADGYHTREDIPRDVGFADPATGEWSTPATVDGTRIWYAGAVGTEPLVARVILERAADAGATIAEVTA